MTMLMEHPIVDNLFGNQDDLDFKALFGPTMEKLIGLDHEGWRTQLKADGFDDNHVQELEVVVQSWTSRHVDKDELTKRLAVVEDINDETSLGEVVAAWLDGLPRNWIVESIVNAQFPMPLDAMCYAGARIKDILVAAVMFETTRRELQAGPPPNLAMSAEQIAEGVALAEMGLVEDAKAWPHY